MIETATENAVRRALSEDMTEDDVTTRWSVPARASARAEVVAREAGTVAGLGVVAEVYRQVDPDVELVALDEDGEPVAAGMTLAGVRGGLARS